MKASVVVIQKLKGHLVVSCQADAHDPFFGSEYMARFALAAVRGGAGGIRANGASDVAAIRREITVPIIGISKEVWSDGDGAILITPTYESAKSLVAAGADIIALDCSARGRRAGALDRLQRIRTELKCPVMADIATLEEAEAAVEIGADLIATTMRGYTAGTKHIERFDPEFLEELCRRIRVPVIAEGKILTPAQARRAIQAGAMAVVVGTAITRPHELTRAFVSALRQEYSHGQKSRTYLAIDLGGTNTKFGAVSEDGRLLCQSALPTPASAGRAGLLAHLKRVAALCATRAADQGISPAGIGVATAGWVDTRSGTVAYATDNLPGWTGTPIAAEVASVIDMPVAVENDANALAVGEKHFGLAKSATDFVCVTLGTGVGGGCFVGDRLHRGKHFFANALGHITIDHSGLPCTCGRRGCLEVYANSAALLRYSDHLYTTAEDVIQAANKGCNVARHAVRQLAAHLAIGLGSIIQLLDPELLILSGGLVENNPLLLDYVREHLSRGVTVWEQRKIQVRSSELGYYAGVFGAAAVAAERIIGGPEEFDVQSENND